jgi:hypothetical protein
MFKFMRRLWWRVSGAPQEWHPYMPWPQQRITFVDGTSDTPIDGPSVRSAPVMRRRGTGDTWQYRRLTAAEKDKWDSLGRRGDDVHPEILGFIGAQ